MANVVGPGANIQDLEAPTPTLDGASEYEYVTILNPLSDDFAIHVAQDVPVDLPFQLKNPSSLVQSGGDLLRNYSLDLKNPDFKSRKRIINDTIIPSGKTINLKGSEAQVAVRQLVNEILQRQGQKRFLADPHRRAEIEKTIIRARGSIQDLMDNNLRSVQQQTNDIINQSNEVADEQPWTGLSIPTIGQSTEGIRDTGTDSTVKERRSPGRPKRTQ